MTRACMLSALAVLTAIKPAAAENFPRVSIDELGFSCLVKNLDLYLAQDRFPVLVGFVKCPVPGTESDRVLAESENSFYPDLPVGTPPEGIPEVKWLSLSERDLQCLANAVENGYDAKFEKLDGRVIVPLDFCSFEQD